MAKIMRIEPGPENIQVSKPALIEPKVASTTGRALEAAGQQMGTLYENLSKVQDLAEKTRASNDLELKIAEVKTRAAKDLDYSDENKAKYAAELNALQADSGGGITIPSSKNEFSQESYKKTGIAGMEIDLGFNAKMIKDMEVQRKTQEAILANKYASSKNPKEKDMVIGDLDKMYAENVSYRAMTPAQVKYDRAAFITKATTDELIADAYANPEETLKEIAKGDQGIYKNATEKTRAVMKVRAQNILKLTQEARTTAELSSASNLAGQILASKGNPEKEQEVLKNLKQFSLVSKSSEAVESAFLKMMNEDPKNLPTLSTKTWEDMSMGAKEVVLSLHKLGKVESMEEIANIQSSFIKEYGSGKTKADAIGVYWVMRAASEAAQRNAEVPRAIANTNRILSDAYGWSKEMKKATFDNFAKGYDWKSNANVAADAAAKKAYESISRFAGRYKVGDSFTDPVTGLTGKVAIGPDKVTLGVEYEEK